MSQTIEKPSKKRVRHSRAKEAQPKSAVDYEKWKAGLSQLPKKLSFLPNERLETANARESLPFEIPSIDDRLTQILERRKPVQDQETTSTTESHDEYASQLKRLSKHAAIVKAQSKKAKDANKEVQKRRALAEKAKKNKPFRFGDLPPELRDMIYRFVFGANAGNKPRLLWAMKEYSTMYVEARKAWCETSVFKFSLLDSKMNTREGLQDGELDLLRHARILVSEEVQVCSTLAALHAPNLETLTLDVSSKVGLGLTIHTIIPPLKKLKKVTLIVKSLKRKVRQREQAFNISHYNVSTTDYFRSMVETRRMLDKMLGRQGECVLEESKPWRQVYVWQVEKEDEVFKPKSAKKYIKFD
ncbi:hypothetical protein BDZ45DRAFT_732332 [Acephala macrosclerotiorum]|nr:hypothetical protein BDZ45DRAFT_732332 [Acephala macrosclerotiorum]